jgi:predicted dehydrogenase
MNRRTFIQRSALAAGGALLARPWASAWARPRNANEDIRVAIIGLGVKGGQHLDIFSTMPGVRVVALCEVDPRRLEPKMAKLAGKSPAPFTSTDPRRVIEREDVDAVVIATPDHWHALLGVWAMQAGKDVYVEKPVAHDVWQGQQLVAAARTYNKIVQAGTQFRSDEGLHAAAAWLREGHIGAPQWGHVAWYELREGVPAASPHRPDWLDYDMYCGPAPLDPLTRKNLHYDWHWWWATGTGDLGNSGIHAFDVCRWFAGVNGWPRRVRGMGGRFVVNDGAQTPNTQLTLVDFPGVPILIENRNLPQRTGMRAMDVLNGIREGFVLHCAGGYFVGLRGGGAVYDHAGKRLQQFTGDGGGQHAANFISAVRSRRSSDLNAPIETGNLSTSICLCGNISVRVGRPANFAACRKEASGHRGADETLAALESHLAANGLTDAKLQLGPWLDLEAGNIIAASGDPALLEAARRLLREPMRAPYQLTAIT